MMREETENSMVSAPFFPVNDWFGALIRRESWEQKVTRFFLENLRDSELKHREGGQSSLSTEGTSSAPRRGLLVGPNRSGVESGRDSLQGYGAIQEELGTDMYTLLYLTWMTNKDLLHSTGKSAQRYVAAWMGGETKGERIHVYVWLSPFAVHQKLSQHCSCAIFQYKIKSCVVFFFF